MDLCLAHRTVHAADALERTVRPSDGKMIAGLARLVDLRNLCGEHALAVDGGLRVERLNGRGHFRALPIDDLGEPRRVGYAAQLRGCAVRGVGDAEEQNAAAGEIGHCGKHGKQLQILVPRVKKGKIVGQLRRLQDAFAQLCQFRFQHECSPPV